MEVAFASLIRPVLRSGVRVVRRDDGHLQLGLDPPDRRVVREEPGLHEVLSALTDRRPCPRPTTATLARCLDDLTAGGWIVDAVPTQEPPGSPVVVLGDTSLSAVVHRLCIAGRLDVTDPAPGVPRLVVTSGEPRRRLSDELMREDLPHVWVACLTDGVRIGPFVQPGVTSCLRCVDAHLGDLDPRRATVLHQLEHSPESLPTPVDACLLSIGVAWAVRDLVRAAADEPPALSSRSVRISADLSIGRHDWLRHPHCGCAWG